MAQDPPATPGPARPGPAALRDLAAAVRRVHAGLYRITPAKAGRPFQMAVGQPSALLARIAAVLDGPGFSTASACHQEAARRWRRWRSGPDPGRLLEPAPLVFSRGDPNLANCLWDGERIRVVDLEYAGWLDRAVDLADLVEHPRSRGTPDQAWTGLVERLILDQPERMRFDAARRLLAFFWLARSLEVRHDPPADVSPTAQLHRVTTLLPGTG